MSLLSESRFRWRKSCGRQRQPHKLSPFDGAANDPLVTRRGADHPGDPKDCRDTTGTVHPRCDERLVLVVQKAQRTLEAPLVQNI